MGLFYDSTYLLVILAALISMAVSVRPHEHDFQQISDRSLVQRHDGTRGGDAHSASGRHLRCDRPPRIR